MLYDPKTFTWGLELEFGDVPRNLTPPYSTWNQFETDIVNIIAPYHGIAADPLGLNPPVGGELNTFPTKTIDKQIEYVQGILDYFTEHDVTPTTSCVSQTHVHVHVPGLCNRIGDTKRLMYFLYQHQNEIIKHANGFEIQDNMSESCLDFLIENNGKKYSKEIIINALQCKTYDDLFELLKIQNKTYEFVTDRYFVNFLSLGMIQTLEFRCFRGTVDVNQIRNIMLFCESILDAAFNGKDIDYNLELPKLNYDHELFSSWEKTKMPCVNAEKLRVKLKAT